MDLSERYQEQVEQAREYFFNNKSVPMTFTYVVGMGKKRQAETLVSRIVNQTERRSSAYCKDDCLVWTGRKNQQGYGLMSVGGRKQVTTHRLMFHIYNPFQCIENRVVRHACHNPSCINPSHLILGSHKDNYRDMVDANRRNMAYGEKAGRRHSLTENDVMEIRRKYKPYVNGWRKLGKEYGVHPATIYAIIKGKTWKHCL